jgi:tRNA U34 5-methylaminomethyl-2-thiouridine-forming methyltransferase MnmC
MERKIIQTADGSKTIHLPEWNENYHSHHGAVQEALHVFIAAGLTPLALKQKEISILEIGFGTGLNAILTYRAAKAHQLNIDYHGIEAFPVSKNELDVLNYAQLADVAPYAAVYQLLHEANVAEATKVDASFKITKHQERIERFDYPKAYFDLVYFDAFGPRVQPELWTVAIFKCMFQTLKDGGVLVTYCSKGDVRRAMIEAGFSVEKIPGPPGKREMLRATAKR